MATCKNCQKNFEIRQTDRVFYKHFDFGDPEMCPDCRLQHKLCFRNERTFYKRKSSLSGSPIISIYDSDCKSPVYSREEWWGDKWDGMDQGRDFDFNRPFFEQFQELVLKVPRIGLFNVNPFNSDFCHQAYDNKNCYMCMVVEKCEDCMYVSHSNSLRDCYDSSFLHDCELCYECLDSNKLYACVECQSCQNSSDLIYCYDCIGCKNCVGCYGLRNKEYHIMNEKYTREAYLEKIKVLELNKYSKLMNCHAYFVELSKGQPHRSSWNLNVDNCSGDYLINCKNAHECFDSFELQDCGHCTWIFNSHDCFDVYGMGHGEFVYEGVGVEAVNNCAFNTFVSDSSDAFYSDISFYCMDLFGCVGLRNKKCCIFNKHYSKDEYEVLKAKIIAHMKKTGEWGKFFPVSLSPYCYNETAANYRYPLTKAEALEKGYKWKDPDPKEYSKQTYEIPDDVKEVDDKIFKKTLGCINCGKNYKVLPQELAYYKKMNIPVVRKCLDCRFFDRFALRNPKNLYTRKCEKCSADIDTTFTPDSPMKVYCEKCYAEFVS